MRKDLFTLFAALFLGAIFCITMTGSVGCKGPNEPGPDPDSAMEVRMQLPPDSLRQEGVDIFK